VAENVEAYQALFAEYTALHDYFGRGGNDVMHRLKAIQREAIGKAPGADRPAEPETAAAESATTAGSSA
jgi:L-ribulokinase